MSTDNALQVVSNEHPLLTKEVHTTISAGTSLEEIIRAIQPDPVLREYANCTVNDAIVSPEYWSKTYPKEGDIVVIRILPGGGGDKNPLRIILTIAAIAISFSTFGATLGAALGFSGAAATVVGNTLWVVGSAILIDAIAPLRGPSRPENSEESPNFFIDGARNRAQLFNSVPVIFGKHRMFPPLGAQTYTELVGDDQYLRMLVVWGYGPLKISDIKIAETPIEDFDDVEYETVEGYSTDAPLTLYTHDVSQTNLSILLSSSVGWVSRTTTANDADEISIDLAFPRGLGAFNDDGKRVSVSIVIQVAYRKVGTTDWLAPNTQRHDLSEGGNRPPDTQGEDGDFHLDDNNDIWEKVNGTWILFDGNYHYPINGIGASSTVRNRVNTLTSGSWTIAHARTVPIREGARWHVAERGQYEVRIRRTTVDNTDDRTFDECYWSTLRTFTDEVPIDFRQPLAMTAISIRATDQLHGVVDQLNGVVSCSIPDWNGTSWVEAETANPASMIRLALQGPAREVPIPDEQIDLVNLQLFHEFCETNNFEYNEVRDYRSSVYQVLLDISSAGRASPGNTDGKWGVVIDDGEQLLTQHFTPRNSNNFSAQRHFVKVPEGIRIEFANKNENWRRDEYIVYADNFDATNAEKFATVTVVGITDPDHIFKYGRFHLAQLILRREQWSLDADFEYIIASRGSRVKITHPVLLIGLASARITEIYLDSSNRIFMVTLDEAVTMEAGNDYGISIRTVVDQAVTAQVDTLAGTTKDLALTIPQNNMDIVVGDLVAFGILGKETVDALAVRVEPRTEISARLIFMPWSSPGVYNADTEAIPAYDTGLTPLPTPEELTIISIRSDESTLVLQGNLLIPRVVIEVEPSQEVSEDNQIDCQIKDANINEPYFNATIESQTPESIILSNVVEGESYDIRLRWRGVGRLIGAAWTEVIDHTVIGQTTVPSALTGLTLSSWSDNTVLLRWNQITTIDVRRGGQVRFRHTEETTSPSWDNAISIGEPIYSESYTILPAKSGYYLARVFDAGGRFSPVASVSADSPTILEYENLATIVESPGFAGTKTNVGVSGSNLVFSSTVRRAGTYTFSNMVTLDEVLNVRVLSILQLEGTNNTDAHIEYSFTVDDPAGTPTWSAWARLDTEQLRARGIRFRLQMTRTNTDILAITRLGAVVDAPQIRGGTEILNGMGEPDDADGNDGDLYIQDNGSIWRKESGAWVNTGIDLTGDIGSKIFTGDIAAGASPTITPNNEGDVFIAQDGRFWSWEGTPLAWALQGDLSGPAGTNSNISTGGGIPDNSTGRNGDLHVGGDGTLYRKDGNVWADTGIDLTGPEAAGVLSGVVAENATPTDDGTTIGDVFIASGNDGRWWKWDGTAWDYQGDLTGPARAGVIPGTVAAGDSVPTVAGVVDNDVFLATDGRWWRWDADTATWFTGGDFTGDDGRSIVFRGEWSVGETYTLSTTTQDTVRVPSGTDFIGGIWLCTSTHVAAGRQQARYTWQAVMPSGHLEFRMAPRALQAWCCRWAMALLMHRAMRNL